MFGNRKAKLAAQRERVEAAAKPELEALKARLEAGELDYPTYRRNAHAVIQRELAKDNGGPGRGLPTWQGPDWLG